MIVSVMQDSTAAVVIVDTALGRRGFSLLTIKYKFAIITAMGPDTKVGQHTMPTLPCLHAIAVARKKRRPAITVSVYARPRTVAEGGAIEIDEFEPVE